MTVITYKITKYHQNQERTISNSQNLPKELIDLNPLRNPKTKTKCKSRLNTETQPKQWKFSHPAK